MLFDKKDVRLLRKRFLFSARGPASSWQIPSEEGMVQASKEPGRFSYISCIQYSVQRRQQDAIPQSANSALQYTVWGRYFHTRRSRNSGQPLEVKALPYPPDNVFESFSDRFWNIMMQMISHPVSGALTSSGTRKPVFYRRISSNLICVKNGGTVRSGNAGSTELPVMPCSLFKRGVKTVKQFAALVEVSGSLLCIHNQNRYSLGRVQLSVRYDSIGMFLLDSPVISNRQIGRMIPICIWTAVTAFPIDFGVQKQFVVRGRIAWEFFRICLPLF